MFNLEFAIIIKVLVIKKAEIIQKPQTMITSSQIEWMYLNDDGEIEPLLDRSKQFLYIGKKFIF